MSDVLEGLGREIEGLRHLITELRPAALDDLGLVPALQALARRAQAIDGLDVQTEIDLGRGRRASGCGAREHDLPRGAGGADERLAPRAGHPGGGLRQRSGHDGAIRVAVTDDGQGLPDNGRPLGPRGDGLQGGFGHIGDARARRAGGRRAGVRPGTGGTGAPACHSCGSPCPSG